MFFHSCFFNLKHTFIKKSLYFIFIMSTFNQKVKNQFFNYMKSKKPLAGKPQRLCVVVKVRIVTPRKPNSARRQVVKVFIFSTKEFMKKHLTAYIPGSGHNLRKHSNVLVRGGGARDLPGVRYSCVRGVLDLAGVVSKTKRRSIYAVPQPVKKKPRRKFRF